MRFAHRLVDSGGVIAGSESLTMYCGDVGLLPMRVRIASQRFARLGSIDTKLNMKPPASGRCLHAARGLGSVEREDVLVDDRDLAALYRDRVDDAPVLGGFGEATGAEQAQLCLKIGGVGY